MAGVTLWYGSRLSVQADSIVPVRPVDQTMVRPILRSALGLPGPVKLISANTASLVHPNGFLKIPLGIDSLGQRLYLHVWRNMGSDQSIHDHRWWFASTVLIGRLMNATFGISPCTSDESDALFIARYTPQGQRFILRDCDKAPVIAIPHDTTTLVRGNCYIQSPKVLHKATARAGTVTLVVRGSPTRSSARVLTTQRECNTGDQFLPAMELDERDTVIHSVLAELA
jgi:hypothetical protein